MSDTSFADFIVATFKARGGVFAVDEDGDLHAVLGDKRCGLYHRSTAAPFLLFDGMTKVELYVVRRALMRAAKAERAAGHLRRLRIWPSQPGGVVWEPES
jgi:hypothetical protein